MLYLGIDIGKNSHVATLIDKNKTVLFKAFSFHNFVEGAESLFKNSLLQMSKLVWKLPDITGFLYTLSLFPKTLINPSLNIFFIFINFIYQIKL